LLTSAQLADVQIEHVGEIVEAVASAARDDLEGRVVVHRNRLRQALVGLHKLLPECVKLANEVKSPDQANRYVSKARAEVEPELEQLGGELPPSSA
jgi:Na+/phosphate symporter